MMQCCKCKRIPDPSDYFIAEGIVELNLGEISCFAELYNYCHDCDEYIADSYLSTLDLGECPRCSSESVTSDGEESFILKSYGYNEFQRQVSEDGYGVYFSYEVECQNCATSFRIHDFYRFESGRRVVIWYGNKIIYEKSYE